MQHWTAVKILANDTLDSISKQHKNLSIRKNRLIFLAPRFALFKFIKLKNLQNWTKNLFLFFTAVLFTSFRHSIIVHIRLCCDKILNENEKFERENFLLLLFFCFLFERAIFSTLTIFHLRERKNWRQNYGRVWKISSLLFWIELIKINLFMKNYYERRIFFKNIFLI